MTSVSSPLDTYQHHFEQDSDRKPFTLLGQTAAELLHDLANVSMVIATLLAELKRLHKTQTTGQAKKASQLYAEIDQQLETLFQLQQQVKAHFQHEQPLNATTKLVPLLQKITKQLLPRFTQNQIRLTSILRLPANSIILGSAVQLERALLNLLTNALESFPQVETTPKFANTTRQVTITTQIQNNSVTLLIVDNGLGIKPADQPLILQPLYTTKQTGTGLGLTEASRIIETEFRGRLELVSSLGHGTTVTITLPMQLD